MSENERYSGPETTHVFLTMPKTDITNQSWECPIKLSVYFSILPNPAFQVSNLLWDKVYFTNTLFEALKSNSEFQRDEVAFSRSHGQFGDSREIGSRLPYQGHCSLYRAGAFLDFAHLFPVFLDLVLLTRIQPSLTISLFIHHPRTPRWLTRPQTLSRENLME